MSFANRKFRDVFAYINTGVLPGLVAAGSSAGSAINMTGVRKLLFNLYGGSGGAASARLLLYGATDSTGAGSTLLGSTDVLPASATSASGGVVVADLRGEYVETNSAGPYVIPVASVGGGSMNIALTAFGYLCSYNPAYNNDAPPAFVRDERILY